MKILLILTLLAFSTSLAAQAYRWVDANGVTHYSDSPPPESEQAASVETRSYRPDPRQQPAAEQEPDSPADRPAPVDSPTSQTEVTPPVSPEVVTLDCTEAVANITSQLSERVQQQRGSFQAGQISREDYEAARDQALQIQATVSEEHCQYANAGTLAFYRCMSDDQSAFDRCQQQHSPIF